MRTLRTGPSWPVRKLSVLGCAAAALCAVAAPLPVPAFEAAAQSASASRGGQGLNDFYAARSGRPLWLGQSGRQVEVLLEILETARLDGLNPREYRVSSLERAVRAARRGDPRAVRKADMMLSQALVDFARDSRRTSDLGIIYVDPELRPGPPSPRAILDMAAAAPSLEEWTARLGWMHPLYGELRHALMTRAYSSTSAERERILLNLERARELPMPRGRHVLVNAAAQRLYMYEDGKVVDTMRVVVGKPHQPTPMMAALIRYTSLNPYWYVPPDLAAERIAPNVVKHGLRYLRSAGYQLVSSFEDTPKVLDPKSVDWKAVEEGREIVWLRQLPGPGNSMGRMKFMFPNSQGIYLHDTPQKELLEEAARLFSGGCVRLEDAARLAEWLYGKPIKPQGTAPEQQVDLDNRVPVYLTYLTAVPSGSFRLTFFDDIYGRDAERLAQLKTGGVVASASR